MLDREKTETIRDFCFSRDIPLSDAHEALCPIVPGEKPSENDHLNAEKGQQGGDHYKTLAIQPIDYCEANNLSPTQFCIIKHVTRSGMKGDEAELDARKALHYCQILLKKKFGIDTQVTYLSKEGD